MDSACPKELATEILNDSDHSTKVAPTTLRQIKGTFFFPQSRIKCSKRFIFFEKKKLLFPA